MKRAALPGNGEGLSGQRGEEPEEQAMNTETATDTTVKPTKTPNDLYVEAEQRAYEAITHRGDGPVTAFVVMSRAVALARSGRCPKVAGVSHDPISNALDRALEGLLVDDADSRLGYRHPSNGS